MTDDALEHALLREGSLQEFCGRWQLIHVLRIAESVRNHGRRHDNRGEAPQRLVVHVLEALVALEWVMFLMPFEHERGLTPQAGHEVEVHALFGETVLIIEDLLLIEVTFYENSDLLALEIHPAILT